ncbi:class I SAM-dependent methyltransferase [Nocardia arthritidis]|uniref:Methyltransferase domain-containing protein n=1 Tax=Nocardia arthritidis TaxID=228602 RepID=A0A6G9YKA9_9NOCA|nr:class I SAM-dependent methyltransferase [Nocardia arthritidis]QIS13621.1 methyltransferase domain-containing protein [Nocardia arthritidis]
MNDEVIALLKGHPWVGDARWSPDRKTVAVQPAASAIAVRPMPGPLLAEHLAHWQHVYEFVYSADRDRHRDDLDLSGWRASDTGAPFPQEHMLEWIEHAVGLALRGKPRIVLEIGCGSGLLAHRIQPHVQAYIGLDVAAPVVARLRAQLAPGAQVLRAAAHELATPPVRAALRTADPDHPDPDCIVLNSVTQCFPNREYLTAVVGDALDLVAAGGTVVVGDIRNLASAPEFARWLETTRNPGLPESDLAARITRRLATDEELLCAPQVFAHIADAHRRAVRTTVYAKPFRMVTELTRYRYDIVYTVDAPPPPPDRSLAWAESAGTVEQRLGTLPDRITRVTGIPNALLASAESDAVTPAQLATAAPVGWTVQLDSADGSRLAVCAPEHSAEAALSSDNTADGCNDPFTRFVRRRLPEVLTDHLARELPATLAPRIVVTEEPDRS